jgi:hypothetical protein
VTRFLTQSAGAVPWMTRPDLQQHVDDVVLGLGHDTIEQGEQYGVLRREAEAEGRPGDAGRTHVDSVAAAPFPRRFASGAESSGGAAPAGFPPAEP